MLQLKCDRCGIELRQPGALVFSPPVGQDWLVEKYHLCANCWKVLAPQLRASAASGQKPEQRSG